jgi:radical SAM superfamily enzyme YgiQ (UPF0313 family)
MAAELSGTPPLGLAYLAAVLLRGGYRVEIVDMNLRCCTTGYLHRFLEIKRPRLVGISTLTESYPNAKRIASIVKRHCRETPVVVGGPHVTFTVEETLARDCFDYVVCREGELTLLELANHCLRGEGHLEDILGLCWRHGSGIKKNAPRLPLEPLERLPWPARDLLMLSEYSHAGALMTGRGCPGGCIFCSARAMSGGRYRKREPDDVIEELRSLRKLGINSLVFLDDTLTADLERLDRILFLMRKEGLDDIPWACESRVDIEDPHFFRKMARAGCSSIQFGVESGSQRILSRLGKGTDLGQVVRAVQEASRAGIGPMCSMMIGLPDDTIATARETIEFGVELQREFYAQAGISIATPFPGTYMYKNAKRYGLTIKVKDYGQYNLYTPVMETRNLSLEQIKNLHFESVDRLRRSARPGMWSLFPPPPDLGGMEVYDYRRHLY